MGFLQALADSCRGVIWFPVMAVGAAALWEFISGVDRIVASCDYVVYWYEMQFLVQQTPQGRALKEKMCGENSDRVREAISLIIPCYELQGIERIGAEVAATTAKHVLLRG
jgi:hypothetical protein